jgi:DNA polymerase III sliding clamp (beta) subunit (PCNA family)
LVSIKGTNKSTVVLENINNMLSLSIINTNYGIQVKETLKANNISSDIQIALDLGQLYKSIKPINSENIFIEIFNTAVKISEKGNSDAFFVTGLVKI